MQYALNKATVSKMAAYCCRFEQLFSCLQENQCLLPSFRTDANNCTSVKLLYSLGKSLCFMEELLRSASNLTSSSAGRERSCFKAARAYCWAISLFIICCMRPNSPIIFDGLQQTEALLRTLQEAMQR
jgi:hypothetical protein